MEGLIYLKPGTTELSPRLATKWTHVARREDVDILAAQRREVPRRNGLQLGCRLLQLQPLVQLAWGHSRTRRATYYYQAIYGGFKVNDGTGLGPPLYKSCAAKGKYKAVIKLTASRGTFLPSMVISSFAMQSPKALEQYGADKGELRTARSAHRVVCVQHPTGTGPFKFKSWTVGEKVEMVRNDELLGQKAKLTSLIIRPIADNDRTPAGAPERRGQRVRPGRATGRCRRSRATRACKVVKRPPFNVAYVTIHQGSRPMNDIKVRQAVAYGLEPPARREQLLLRAGKVAKSSCRRACTGGRQGQKYPYNPDEGEAAPELVGLPRPVPGRLLVSDRHLEAVHA